MVLDLRRFGIESEDVLHEKNGERFEKAEQA